MRESEVSRCLCLPTAEAEILLFGLASAGVGASAKIPKIGQLQLELGKIGVRL